MCLLPPSWYGGRIDLVTVILRFDAPGNRSHTPLCGLLEHAESHKLPLRLRSILRDQFVNDTYRYLGKTQRKAVGWLEQVTDADYQKLPLVLGLRTALALSRSSTHRRPGIAHVPLSASPDGKVLLVDQTAEDSGFRIARTLTEGGYPESIRKTPRVPPSLHGGSMRIVQAVALAGALALTVSLSAQEQKPPAEHTMTGCVAKGPTADTFVVNNTAEKGPKVIGVVSSKVALEPHVGHKIDITGTEVPTAEAEKMKPAPPKADHYMRINAIKMVSTTCP